MKRAQPNKHAERYAQLCDEMAGWLHGAIRAEALQIEENVKCRAALHLLEEIRALQLSGFDAEQIVDALIEKAESRIQPPRVLSEKVLL